MGDPAEAWIGLQQLWDGQWVPAYRLGEPHLLYPFLTRYRVECPDSQSHRRVHRAAKRDGWACHHCGEVTLDTPDVDWRLDARGRDLLFPFKDKERLAVARRHAEGDATDFVVVCYRCSRDELAPPPAAPATSTPSRPGPPSDDPLLARRAELVARVVRGEPPEQVAAAFGVTLQTADLWYQQYFQHDRLVKAPSIYWRVGGSPVPPAWVLSSRSTGQVQLSISCARGHRGSDHRRLHKVAQRSDWACHYCGVSILDYQDIDWVASGQLRRPPRGYAAAVTLTASRPELEWQMATVDHVVPRAEGGRSTMTNTVAACRRCNAGKGHQSADWWRERLAGLTDISNAS